MLDLVTCGNICVDIFLPPHRRPPPGGLTQIPTLEIVPGGNGSNTAIAAARLGVKSAVAGVLGDDLFGRDLRRFLEDEEVDVSLVTHLERRQSPSTVVLNDESGERSFVFYAGTDADFALPERVFQACGRRFHFAGPELLGSFWPHGTVDAARRLNAAGFLLSLDTFVEPGPTVIEDHRALLPLLDVAMPNEEEGRGISGQREPRDICRYLCDAGVKTAVVKRGAGGAIWLQGGKFFEATAARVPVVDTCGAGDNFSGAFLAAMLRGRPLQECLEIGCAMGTRCVTAKGSLTATADREFLARLRARLER